MKVFFRLIATLMLLTFIFGCGEKSSSSSTGILDEISGVWRAKGDGSMVSIIYADNKVRMLFGDDSLPVSLGEIDNINKTANMNVTLRNGKLGVWTIRQIWDKQKTTFHLQLTLHDGTQDELAFVRKISVDDLNKIANAEARVQPGSISNVAKVADSVAPASPSVQAQTTNIAAPQLPAVAAIAEQPPVPPATPLAVTWAPSFDCTKASTGSERLICSNKELSAADVKLAQIYKTVLNTSTDKESLRNTQNAWRKNERDACSDVQCMLSAYQSRLAQLAQ
jgi:uncharacterized protein YecT (DUF1311 family)